MLFSFCSGSCDVRVCFRRLLWLDAWRCLYSLWCFRCPDGSEVCGNFLRRCLRCPLAPAPVTYLMFYPVPLFLHFLLYFITAIINILLLTVFCNLPASVLLYPLSYSLSFSSFFLFLESAFIVEYFQALCFHDEVSEMSLPVSDDITHFLCLHKLPFFGYSGKNGRRLSFNIRYMTSPKEYISTKISLSLPLIRKVPFLTFNGLKSPSLKQNIFRFNVTVYNMVLLTHF